MSKFNVFEIIEAKPHNDSLRISRAQKRIVGHVTLVGFIDKDTEQQIIYCPSLDATGYGETEAKAMEMIKFSISEYFKFLVGLSTKKMEEELRSIGFAHVNNKTKEFSKASVDIAGQLQNLNAVDNKIKRFTLEAA